MDTALLLDGDYLSGLYKDLQKTTGGPVWNPDYGLFLAWLKAELKIEDDFGFKGYYHGLPAKAGNWSTDELRAIAADMTNRMIRRFTLLEKEYGFVVRDGIVKAKPCRGGVTVGSEDGTTARLPCDYIHFGQKRVDTLLVADVARLLFKRSDIQRIVIVSGDEDMMPAVDLAKGEKKDVVMIVDNLGSTHPGYFSANGWKFKRLSSMDLEMLRYKKK